MAKTQEMAERRGGQYCVAGGPGEVSCMNTFFTKGVTVHEFPKNDATSQKWIRFVRIHRPNWVPSARSLLCSEHFAPSCYRYNRSISLGEGSSLKPFKNYLIPGSIPSIPAKSKPDDTAINENNGITPRQKRAVSC